MKVALIFLCAVASLGARAAELNDLYFEIHGARLAQALPGTKSSGNPYCSVYWTPKKLEAVPVLQGGSEEATKVLASVCARKAAIVLPFSLAKYLAGFEKSGSSGQWIIYQDATGVNDINEVWVKEGKLELGIIEKRPIGTTRLEYSYRKVGGAQEVDKATRRSYEGIQNVITETSLKWSEVGAIRAPVRAETRTVWSVTQEDKGTLTRETRETFTFKNYQINKDKAAKRFSQL